MAPLGLLMVERGLSVGERWEVFGMMVGRRGARRVFWCELGRLHLWIFPTSRLCNTAARGGVERDKSLYYIPIHVHIHT